MGIESLSAVSKGVYHLATPLLRKHRKLKRDYIKLEGEQSCFAELLITIVRDPLISLYVTKFYWEYLRRKWHKLSDGRPPGPSNRWGYHLPYPTEVLEQLERLIHEVRIITADEETEWIAAVRRGDEEPLLALLILHLSHLQNMECSPPSAGTVNKIAGMFHHICEVNEQSHLSQLNDVFLFYDDRRHPCDLYSALFSMPSMRTLRLERLCVDDDEQEIARFSRMRDSRVEDFTTVECHIPDKVLCEMVKKTKFLKSFAWETRPLYVGELDRVSFDSLSLCHSLMASAGSTLQSLTLQLHGRKSIPLDGLRGLERLCELHTDVALLFSPDGSNISTWPSRLPPNLEKLSLTLEDTRGRVKYDHIVQTPENFCEAFRCLLRAKKSQTPRLNDILILMKSSRHRREAYDHIESPVSRAGILLHLAHPGGARHMDPGCGDCAECNSVVERFLQETGGPATHVANSAMGCGLP